jgi:hypothetical protein
MRTTRFACLSLFLSLFSLFACGGKASPRRQSSTGGSTGGSEAYQGGAGGQVLSDAGGAETAGLLCSVPSSKRSEPRPFLRTAKSWFGLSIRYLINDVVMVARGDTLVVAAYLSGDTVPTLTYLEIDSNLLP